MTPLLVQVSLSIERFRLSGSLNLRDGAYLPVRINLTRDFVIPTVGEYFDEDSS